MAQFLTVALLCLSPRADFESGGSLNGGQCGQKGRLRVMCQWVGLVLHVIIVIKNSTTESHPSNIEGIHSVSCSAVCYIFTVYSPSSQQVWRNII